MKAFPFTDPGEWFWGPALDHLWQSSLFALIVLLGLAALRRAPAGLRYSLYMAIPVKFLLPSPLLVDLVHRAGLDLSSAFLSIAWTTSDPLAFVNRQSSLFHPAGLLPRESPESLILVFWGGLAVWCAGTALLLAGWWLRQARVYRDIRNARLLADCRETEILERVAKRLSLTRKIQLVTSPDFSEIGVFGIWRPHILLPERITGHLSDSELEAILLHELVHIARWDNLTSHMSMTACSLFWFHPLVWFADRRIVTERERVCDDRVIELGSASRTYAESLIKVLRFGLGFRMAGVSCAGGSNLMRRIEQIASGEPAPAPSLGHRLVVAGVLCALLAVSVAAVEVDRRDIDPKYRKPAPACTG